MPHEPTHSLLAPLAPNREAPSAPRQGGMTASPGAAIQPPLAGRPASHPGFHPVHPAGPAGQPRTVQQPEIRHAAMARPEERVQQQRPQPAAPPVSAAPRMVPEPPAPDTPSSAWANMRDSSVFLRANRHSSRVRLLRIALPVIAVLIIAGIAGAYILSQASLPQVTIAETAFENGRMVMRNPVLDGVDGEQRPYRLTAKQAVQDPQKPRQVELDSISAEVPVQEGIYAHILAGTGFYDGEAKHLDLGGEIEVVTDDGMTAKFKDAAVDIGAGTLKTVNPVAMTTEQAEISAESMFVEDNGAKVVFERRVKMTIFPDKIQALKEKASGESGEGNGQ